MLGVLTVLLITTLAGWTSHPRSTPTQPQKEFSPRAKKETTCNQRIGRVGDRTLDLPQLCKMQSGRSTTELHAR
ncbi:hypothetical protein BS50DRAFT_25431 [Corynespora cassiicola Philippines]|uniref:Secreted protein n=1 Tax=Corynespora cassiicola Philippines TaxID=1448308 RepID=A0A2T2PAZ5_CORCC|nr:hypothetical protein BS50DRAFT_25431 [Corynespora cassiicola Philippines]